MHFFFFFFIDTEHFKHFSNNKNGKRQRSKHTTRNSMSKEISCYNTHVLHISNCFLFYFISSLKNYSIKGSKNIFLILYETMNLLLVLNSKKRLPLVYHITLLSCHVFYLMLSEKLCRNKLKKQF
jgi:hypothetical protein